MAVKAGQSLVQFDAKGAVHITCTGARKGWTVCGKLVPTTAAWRMSGNPEVLDKSFRRATKPCRSCDRMADAVHT